MTTLKIKDSVFTNNVRGDVGLSDIIQPDTSQFELAVNYLKSDVNPFYVKLLALALDAWATNLSNAKANDIVEPQGICSGVSRKLMQDSKIYNLLADTFHNHNDAHTARTLTRELLTKLMPLWIAEQTNTVVLGYTNDDSYTTKVNQCRHNFPTNYPVEYVTLMLRQGTTNHDCEVNTYASALRRGELYANPFRRHLLAWLRGVCLTVLGTD